jgi:hypothetical protein
MARQRKNPALNSRFDGPFLHFSRAPHETVATNPLAGSALIRDVT